MASEFFDKVRNMGMLVLGAIILAVHVLIFRSNQHMFTVVMCLYIIGYSVLVIVLMYKNRGCYRQPDFDVLLNMSLYTVFLEVFLALLAFWFLWRSGPRYG